MAIGGIGSERVNEGVNGSIDNSCNTSSLLIILAIVVLRYIYVGAYVYVAITLG